MAARLVADAYWMPAGSEVSSNSSSGSVALNGCVGRYLLVRRTKRCSRERTIDFECSHRGSELAQISVHHQESYIISKALWLQCWDR